MTAVWLWTVVPVAALHVVMWWRSRELLRFQLVLDLLLAAVLAPALAVSGLLLPVRCLEDSPPYIGWHWDDATAQQPTQSDVVLQFHPWMEETRRQLLAGRLPLISERIGAGLPLLANGQTGIWAPFNLPVWALGSDRGTTVMAAWKLELAGLGGFLFLRRRWRLRWSAAAAGATAFAGSACVIAWLLVPMAWVIALTPWAWWGTHWMLSGRPRAWRIVGMGVAAGWLLGSGLHPESSAIVSGSAVLAGCICRPRRWWRLVVAVAVAAAVALALAWPTIGYILASSRSEATAATNLNLEPPPAAVRIQAVQQLLVPMALGHPGRGDWSGGYPYAAAAVGVGGLALGLVAAGGVRRRHRRLLWAALASLAVAAVLAYRLPPLDGVLVRLPPLDHMTLPRFVVLVPWALSVWAALAVEGALGGQRLRPLWRVVAVAAMLTVAMAAVRRGLVPVDLMLMALTAVAAALSGSLLGRPRWLAAAVAVELSLYAIAINPVAAARDRLPTPPLVERLQRLHEERGGRVVGLGGALPPNLAARYGLPDLRAFDPLRPAPFVHMMAVLGDPDPILGGRLRHAPPRLCGAWSVRFLVTPPGVEAPGWDLHWTSSSGAIWSNPRWLPEIRVVGRATAADGPDAHRLVAAEALEFDGEAVVPEGTAPIRATRAELRAIVADDRRVRATVDCDGPCLLVVARAWAPGWWAWVDGVPIPVVRTNLAGLGAVAPAGRHEVELRYLPWKWQKIKD